MNIQPETRYQNFTDHMRYLNDKMIEAFGLFVKLASAIIGGTVYLSVTQTINETARGNIAFSSSLLLSFVGTATIIIIFTNLFSYFRYRRRLSELFPDIPYNPAITSYLCELAMCAVILVTCASFWPLNPLH